MTPAEKISTLVVNLELFCELELMISGATYPGVPHLLNKYSGTSHKDESPKSTILS